MTHKDSKTTTHGVHGSTNAGPHSSNAANSADPRIDSDLDGNRNAGLNQTTHTTHATHATGYPTATGTHTAGHTAGTTGVGSTTHGSTTHGSTAAGPHSSTLMNKLDPRVDSDLDGGRHAGMNQTTHPATGHPSHTGAHTGTAGIGSTTHRSTNAGPHTTHIANAMDPRVDSDLSGGRHAGLNQTTHAGGHPAGTHTIGGTGTHTAGHTGTVGTGAHTAGHTGTVGSSGPVHNSNLMNKLDPRVDSDVDGSRNMGMNQTTHTGAHPTHTTGHTGTHTTGHTGAVGSTGAYTSSHPGTVGSAGTHTVGHAGTAGSAGPVHNSSLLNKVDPRVDSDLDGSRNMGMNQTTHTTGQPTSATGHAGTHTTGHTGAVGSTGAYTTGHPGAVHSTGTHNVGHTGPVGTTGTHPVGTAGPVHNSNLMNKLDPRVDSDVDGSKNMGMNQTTRPNY